MNYAPHEVEWTSEKVGRVWDYYGSIPEFRPLYFSAHSGAAIVERVEREIGLRGKRVLDFGAGHGDLLAQLFARGVAAHALELSEHSAASIRERFAGEPLFGGVSSSYPDGSFDVVFLVEVVEHLLDDELEPTARDVERLLAPGGHVVATAPNAEQLVNERAHCPDCGASFHRWQHQRSVDGAFVERLFAGLERVRAEGLNWQASRRARLLRRAGEPHLFYVGRRPTISIPLPP